MMRTQPRIGDFCSSFGSKSTTRQVTGDSSRSTRSCHSLDELEDLDACVHVDPKDCVEPKRDGFLQDASDRINLGSSALQVNVNVKNTFLDIRAISEDETDMPTLRRRATSAPPSRAPIKEQEVLSFHDLSPTASPQGKFEVLVGPVKECTMRFLRTMNEGSSDAVSELLRNCLSPEASLQVDFCNNDHCTGVANYHGSHGLINFIGQLREAFPDLALSLDDVVTERRFGVDPVALARVSCTGTQKYPLLPMMPSGRRLDFALHMETLEKVNGRALRLRWSFSLLNPQYQIYKEITVAAHGSMSSSSLALVDAEEDTTDVANVQPLALQPVFACVVPVSANAFATSQQPMQMPEITSPTTFESPKANALWQRAQQAELAAAALRAQAREEDTTDVANVQPLALQPVFACAVPVYANAFATSQQPMQMPEITSPTTFEDPKANALWQRAQQAELAAAALRAQARLAEISPSAKSARRAGRPLYRQGGSKPQPASVTVDREPTTVMLRNIPNDVTRPMLVKMLDSNGFAGKYDFVYLPIDFAKSGNLGYAFVNMLTHDDALRMQTELEGFHNWGIRSARRCEVVWSSTQGIARHIEHYRDSPIMHESVPEEFKPLLFGNGEIVPFPSPTRKLEPLRQFNGKGKR